MLDKSQVARIAKELIDEEILVVERHQIRIHTIMVPRDRLLFFQLALCAALNGDIITHKGEYGYTTVQSEAENEYGEKFKVWRISSNKEDEQEQSLLLTRKLATELYEVVYFLLGDNPPVPEPLARKKTEAVDSQVEAIED